MGITFEALPCSGHVWDQDQFKINVDPTCIQEGEQYESCIICGKQKIIKIPAFGHTIVGGEVEEAICEEDGYVSRKYCDICGEELEAGHDIPASGHKIVGGEEIEATCTQKGYITEKICSICHITIQAGKELPMLNHTVIGGNVVQQASCLEDGYISRKYCVICKQTIESAKEIKATGHKWDDGIITQNATSLEKGEKMYTCNICGVTKKEALTELPKDNLLKQSITVSKKATKQVMIKVK